VCFFVDGVWVLGRTGLSSKWIAFNPATAAVVWAATSCSVVDAAG
jgi:hypothetical protein